MITLHTRSLGEHANPAWGGKVTRDWSVRLAYQGRGMTTQFHQNSAHVQPPTVTDVLGCLFLDASCGEMTFEGYCADFGENPDSRSVHRTWQRCRANGKALRRMLGDDYETIRTEHAVDAALDEEANESREDFERGGYYDSMVDSALDELNKRAARADHVATCEHCKAWGSR